MRKQQHKRSFLLVEVLTALSLICIVLTPCIRFYYGIHRSIEDEIISLQLPAVIDNCFFAIEDAMREQMLNGIFPSSGSGELTCTIATSQGKSLQVPYTYSIDIRKGMRGDSCIKACFADVLVEVFPNHRHTMLIQRSLCVIL
ncbi:hypothetical protein BOKEGFJH_00701 [Chlamydia avium]|uniref:Inner membrane protein n=2 Tax=Chlamydia avium TaxID=1457141 RepID=W8JRW2_9CHLA|nr:type II secretion system protein [Chlamydia avium]AHK63578.1 Putative inner membrane protein [Chlamydia avium 10DC88]EPP36159.1 putative inner membrane protein [Chlamydia psittaci 10_743_SC13]EPP38648.1 putative inner membrane protein [Chlamydia avium]VVT43166.1 hypothetical protein BOKEGFJH_00701 [Chlamydia avium]